MVRSDSAATCTDILPHSICTISSDECSLPKADLCNAQLNDTLSMLQGLGDLRDPQLRGTVSSCPKRERPRHYFVGERAGPHALGAVMACECCAGKCDLRSEDGDQDRFAEYANYERQSIEQVQKFQICKICGCLIDGTAEAMGMTECFWHHNSKESSEEDWGAYSDD